MVVNNNYWLNVETFPVMNFAAMRARLKNFSFFQNSPFQNGDIGIGGVVRYVRLGEETVAEWRSGGGRGRGPQRDNKVLDTSTTM